MNASNNKDLVEDFESYYLFIINERKVYELKEQSRRYHDVGVGSTNSYIMVGTKLVMNLNNGVYGPIGRKVYL